jgi:hypothetical protein
MVPKPSGYHCRRRNQRFHPQKADIYDSVSSTRNGGKRRSTNLFSCRCNLDAVCSQCLQQWDHLFGESDKITGNRRFAARRAATVFNDRISA